MWLRQNKQRDEYWGMAVLWKCEVCVEGVSWARVRTLDLRKMWL